MNVLPGMKKMRFSPKPGSGLRKIFPLQSYTGGPYLSQMGVDLMSKLLELDPDKRITCAEALKHPYFSEIPLAKDPSMMPTFPSGNEGGKVRHRSPQQMFAHHEADSPEPDLL